MLEFLINIYYAVDLNEDKMTNTKEEVKVVSESLRSLLFRKRMKILSPHRRPLKDRMKDKMLICFYHVHLHQEGSMK